MENAGQVVEEQPNVYDDLENLSFKDENNAQKIVKTLFCILMPTLLLM